MDVKSKNEIGKVVHSLNPAIHVMSISFFYKRDLSPLYVYIQLPGMAFLSDIRRIPLFDAVLSLITQPSLFFKCIFYVKEHI